MLQETLTTFVVLSVAELGDKSQFVCLALSSRNAPFSVLLGATLAFAVLNGLAVAVGGLLGAAIPVDMVRLAAIVAFVAFGMHTLLADDEDGDLTEVAPTGHPVLASAMLIGLAELGDKTQLTVGALATVQRAESTWIGATAALVWTSALAIAIGAWLLPRLPKRRLRQFAGALFLLVAAWLIVGWAA